MTREEATVKICPYMSNIQIIPNIENGFSVSSYEEFSECCCVAEKCMFWIVTIDGKKEIDRYKIPYETYPHEAGNKHRQLIKDGYEEIKRELYVKYEEANEGYCKHMGEKDAK